MVTQLSNEGKPLTLSIEGMTCAACASRIERVLDKETTIKNVANIRIKETDRLIAIVNELRRLGQTVEHGEVRHLCTTCAT